MRREDFIKSAGGVFENNQNGLFLSARKAI